MDKSKQKGQELQTSVPVNTNKVPEALTHESVQSSTPISARENPKPLLNVPPPTSFCNASSNVEHSLKQVASCSETSSRSSISTVQTTPLEYKSSKSDARVQQQATSDILLPGKQLPVPEPPKQPVAVPNMPVSTRSTPKMQSTSTPPRPSSGKSRYGRGTAWQPEYNTQEAASHAPTRGSAYASQSFYPTYEGYAQPR